VSARRASAAEHARGVLSGDRGSVARAITLLESRRAADAAPGRELIDRLAPHGGGAIRVGITGPPGVGKSTLVEALGLELVGAGRRLAVLAIDPTSPVSGGSILGDKTRMAELARHERAFIRPSPSGGALGGVARRTRESIVVCEAAGYDVVFVETVGVGQSEVEVASMVDFFLVLLQPGSGDELQGIKRGVLELADALLVTKADGGSRELALRTQADYGAALELLREGPGGWRAPVLRASAREGEGIRELWEVVLEHHRLLSANGQLERRRRSQDRAWFWAVVREQLEALLAGEPAVAAALPELEREVEERRRSAPGAASRLIELFAKSRG
jgi:LAO/AO transport system kinase